MTSHPFSGTFMNAQPVNPANFDPALVNPTIADQPLTYRPAPRGATGDSSALIRQHLPLVRRIAWHVHGSMSNLVEIEDLVQVGLVALVEAASSFEERGVEFGHYLKARLRGAMIDELRRQATTTRGAMRRRRDYSRAIAALTQPNGQAPTDEAVAQKLGVTVEKLRAEYKTAEAVRMDSIDDVYSDDLPWFADDTPDAFEQLAESDLRDALIAAISALPKREAMVIQLYYVEELNLEEIGQVLNVGAARVCQIKSAAHAKLKKALAGQA
ncbi:sigma-70 family RNA polymerase sigma factor [Sphingomonas sp. SORGH_AS_0879]|uniref:sigma-70 family RNA polymerase sigma factor n=1 Tax=Sphingomonas sp. SORGH_AS_0879 TaxID=3041790 RepID=UPI0027896924|nr:RNA polymerase sigma factor FliA [Sphingomonas sp. SORGH_AS_0879]MDQ1229069.1 RNA polymerase sigma factor for flagellar operon FliA [Sphingomonas sp. SORGH_AS_0879]